MNKRIQLILFFVLFSVFLVSLAFLLTKSFPRQSESAFVPEEYLVARITSVINTPQVAVSTVTPQRTPTPFPGRTETLLANATAQWLAGDSDYDGLSNGDEVNKWKTDPLNPDTDGDGLKDGTEVSMGLNPLNLDTDNDGIPDAQDSNPQNKPSKTPVPFPDHTKTVAALLTQPASCTRRENWIPYQVKPGDTLFKIASNRGITVTELIEGNCLSGSQIQSGSTLYVPIGPQTTASGPTMPAFRTKTAVAGFPTLPEFGTQTAVAGIPTAPAFTPTPAPTVVVLYEWPKVMEMGRSDSIIISLIQTSDHQYIPVVEVTDHAAELASPIPAGTPGVPLDKALGEDYEAYAVAKLVGTTFDFQPVTNEQQSIEQQKVSWEWNIVPKEPKTQTINASIEVLWVIKGTQQIIKRQVVWRDRMEITVKKPLVTMGQLNFLSLTSGFGTLGVTFPWIYSFFRKQKKEKAPTKKPSGKRTTAKKTTILFLAADPTNASRLRQGEELREIQENLQLARSRDNFSLHQRMSVRPDDVSQAMLDVQPNIVHFSGHGTATGELCFENQLGEYLPVPPDALEALFEQFVPQVRCVVLNACYSEVQARAISNHVDCVIGMSRAVGDKAAIAFAIGFYQALGSGRTIEEAYKLGIVQIQLQNIPEHLTPILLKRGSTE